MSVDQLPAALTLSLDEVAAAMGYSRRTLDRERRSGRFPFPVVLVGKRERVPREIVERYCAAKGLRRSR